MDTYGNWLIPGRYCHLKLLYVFESWLISFWISYFTIASRPFLSYSDKWITLKSHNLHWLDFSCLAFVIVFCDALKSVDESLSRCNWYFAFLYYNFTQMDPHVYSAICAVTGLFLGICALLFLMYEANLYHSYFSTGELYYHFTGLWKGHWGLLVSCLYSVPIFSNYLTYNSKRR